MPASVTEPDAGAARRELWTLLLRFFAALAVISVAVGVLSYLAREPAQVFARALVARLGIGGLALGAFSADGLAFPVPPQFYMLLAVAAGKPAVPSFLAICCASVVAGCFGYTAAQLASRLPWIARATQRHREALARVFETHGYRSALVASVLPIPYSVLCIAAGVTRLPRTFIALVSLCRIPKLLGYYWLLHAGWSLFKP